MIQDPQKNLYQILYHYKNLTTPLADTKTQTTSSPYFAREYEDHVKSI